MTAQLPSYGCCDMGQGSDTVLCQIAAEELGIPMKMYGSLAQTRHHPDALASTASRQTFVPGTPLKAAQVKKYLLKLAGELLVVSGKSHHQNGKVHSQENPDQSIEFSYLAREAHLRGKQFIALGWYDNTTADVDPGRIREMPMFTIFMVLRLQMLK